MKPGQVAEIKGSSNASFEDAVRRGIGSVNKTLQNVRCLWMKDQQVRIGAGAALEYHVDMWITFISEDWEQAV